MKDKKLRKCLGFHEGLNTVRNEYLTRRVYDQGMEISRLELKMIALEEYLNIKTARHNNSIYYTKET